MSKEQDERLPLFIVLSGPSGAGKDTVLRLLLDSDSSIVTVVTAKTRSPRVDEIDGVNHLFLTRSEFRERIKKGEFLEHAEVYGHLSGVPRDQVVRHLKNGLSVIVRTDVQGARSLKESVPGAALIFLTVPDREILERRLRSRDAESSLELEERLKAASVEMSDLDWFDHVVLNLENQQAATVGRLLDIIATERKRPGRPIPHL